MATHIPKFSILSPRILRVLGCNPGQMTLQGTNTYIIGTGKRRVLLDTGEKNNEEYISLLKSTLKKHDIDISTIVISHWHHDHIGGLSGVLSMLENKPSLLKYPRSDEKECYTFDSHSVEFVKDMCQVEVEGATLQLHHTPGHTTDHVVVRLADEDVLFSGDCILGEGTAVFEDLYTYMLSLQKILDLHPKTIYPGHGPVIDNPVERIQYYIHHRNEREQQIMNVLRDNPARTYTPMQLVEIIYKETPRNLYPAAAFNVSHHLTKLLKEGLVRREQEDNWCLEASESGL